MALILWNGGTYCMECLVTLTVEGGNINVEYSVRQQMRQKRINLTRFQALLTKFINQLIDGR